MKNKIIIKLNKVVSVLFDDNITNGKLLIKRF